ncbi:MAG TPA: beta-ketoacyl-ACP reductase [Nitrospiraceae bacterium]|jgi:acetoacetyl-CoA reductase|nr:beta-ketoacyl-ACP reductase [Nitrospiraceae bacterium]
MGTILKDRVALVTGAVGGIGRAISLHLAQEGAILALNYLVERDQDAEAFLKQLTHQGYRAKLYKADISGFDEAVSLVETVNKDFGPIDVLINNAGITIDKTLRNMSPDQWEKVIGVDLSSVFYCSRAVIGQMLERGYGRIINISSVVGQKGNFGQTNYAAAKAGIIGFTKALALETAKKGITVNAIAPGFVKTAMTDNIPKDVMDKIVESIPIGRLAEPSEIARAIVFLADEKSSYITGQVMGINGGFYM